MKLTGRRVGLGQLGQLPVSQPSELLAAQLAGGSQVALARQVVGLLMGAWLR